MHIHCFPWKRCGYANYLLELIIIISIHKAQARCTLLVALRKALHLPRWSPDEGRTSSSLCPFHLSPLGMRSLLLAISVVSSLVSARFVPHFCKFCSLFLAKLHPVSCV